MNSRKMWMDSAKSKNTDFVKIKLRSGCNPFKLKSYSKLNRAVLLTALNGFTAWNPRGMGWNHYSPFRRDETLEWKFWTSKRWVTSEKRSALRSAILPHISVYQVLWINCTVSLRSEPRQRSWSVNTRFWCGCCYVTRPFWTTKSCRKNFGSARGFQFLF